MTKKQSWQDKLKQRPKLIVTPIVVVILLGFLAGWLWLVPHGQRIDASSFQVVYLTSGQAYFGKLKNSSGEYLQLEDPYTIQNVAASDGKQSNTAGQTTLLKVRDQVYGPDNSMALRSENVLFWQNLRSDSKVTQAIKAKEQ